MKIISNTSRRESAHLRSIVCRVHKHMTKLEGRKCPCWDTLRTAIGGTAKSHDSGHAFLKPGGRQRHDVWLTIPHSHVYTTHQFAHLVYHELMHSYGYKHSQYTNIRTSELDALFPLNDPIRDAHTPKKDRPALTDLRLARAEQSLRAWQTKAKRAETAIKKLRARINGITRRKQVAYLIDTERANVASV